jgi:hypothetical protein
MPEIINKKQLAELLDEANRERNMEIIERWLVRGDSCAVYTNMDLGHPEAGGEKFVSFGSEQAQIEDAVPPERLPDIGGQINWRFQLTHICRPEVENV